MLFTPFAWSADFFWVGGTGDWNDINHWATTSGGTTIQFGIPSANDDVYFDVNSFGAASDTVDLLNIAAQCRSLRISTPLSVTFIGDGTLLLTGHLDIELDIQWEYSGLLELRPSFTNTIINGRGHPLGGLIQLIGNATGGWEIVSDLTATASIGVQPSRLRFAPNVTLIAQFIALESDGRTDYSNLNIQADISVQLDIDPSEALSIENCNVNITGRQVNLLVTGVPNFKLGTIRLGGFDYSENKIFRGARKILTNSLIIKGHYEFDISLDLQYFEISPGSNHIFGNDQVEVNKINARGTCEDRISLKGLDRTEFISKTGATLDLAYLFVENITASGAAAWNASESNGTGIVTGWNFSSLFGEDRYWIGDTGSWEDRSNWSYTSGGAGGACIPTAANNVIFDAASFSTATPQVDVPDGDWATKSIDFAGITADVTLYFEVRNTLSVYGSMELSPRLTWTSNSFFLPLQVTFKGGGPRKTIRTYGRTEFLEFEFDDSRGDWRILDSLSIADRILLTQGSLSTADNPITCRSISQGSDTYLDLGSSQIYVKAIPTNFNVRNPVLSFNDCNSKDASILIEDEISEARISFSKNIITERSEINKIVSYGLLQIYAEDSLKANLVELHKNTEIIAIGHIDSLLLSSGTLTQFYGNIPGSGISINHFDAIGSCLEPITIHGATDFYLSSLSGQRGEFLHIQNIDAVGGPWVANESLDLGTNTGWTFSSPAVGRTLYWSGGKGLWFDTSHWSESSGGPTGACPPTRIDDVIFEVGSATTGDTIQLPFVPVGSIFSGGSQSECKTFESRAIAGAGVVFTGEELYVYGSLYAPAAVDLKFRTIYLKDSLPSAEILVQGVAPSTLGIISKGTYTAIAPINAPSTQFFIAEGTFFTGGYPMDLRSIGMGSFSGNNTTLDLANSQVKLFGSRSALSSSAFNARILSDDAWITFMNPSAEASCNESTGGVNMEFTSGANPELRIQPYLSLSNQADFTTVRFNGNGTINGPVAFDTLELNKGFSYTIQNPASQDLTIRDYLSAEGSSCSPLSIKTPISETTNSTIRFETAAVSAIDYARIDRVDATGPGIRWAGNNSVNINNSSLGWIFETAPTVETLDRFFLGPNVTICNRTPDLIVPSLPSGLNATFEWQNGATTQDFQPTGPGAYYLDITFDDGNCRLRDSIIITGPAYDLNPDTILTVCESNEMEIEFPNLLASGYQWSTESGSIVSSTLTGARVSVPGVYFLQQTLGMCMDSTRYQVDSASMTSRDSLITSCEAIVLITPLETYQISRDTSLSETYLSMNGCDSVLNYIVNVLDPSFSESEIIGCAPVNFTSDNGINHQVWQDSLIEERFAAITGCDSIRRYNVKIIGQSVSTTFAQTFCAPDTLFTTSSLYLVSSDTTIIEQLTSAGGCDSTITWNVIVTQDAIQTASQLTWCEPSTLITPLDIYQISTDTVISETYQSSLGCDSLHTYSLSIQSSAIADTLLTGCDSITFSTTFATYTLYQDTNFTEILTNFNGCDSLINYNVQLSKSEPISSLVDAQSPSCFRQNNGQINLWDPTSTTPVVWKLDNAPIDTIRNLNGLPAGAYSLSLSYGEGCQGDTIVTLIDSPEIVFNLPDSIQGAIGRNLTLSETPTGGIAPYLFSWSGTPEVFNAQCPLCTTLDFEVIGSGWILVDIEDAQGCVLTDSIWLNVPEAEGFYLPNPFSPNSDGINDVLQIYGRSDITVEEIKIFDRWGSIIHSGSQSPTPLDTDIWDGQTSQPGTYIVMLTLTWTDGHKEILTREVQLLK
ncbi:MAG: gliding motility-associated C-terminal domain-containing protein [Saprospiraceae bacterium]